MGQTLQSNLPVEEIDAIKEDSLYSEDLAPVPSNVRKWGTKDIAFLWVGMSVCIPTYMLASSLISDGMNWWQAILTVALGNLIVLAPMILNGHAGTKYGITFPVFPEINFTSRLATRVKWSMQYHGLIMWNHRNLAFSVFFCERISFAVFKPASPITPPPG